MAEYLRREPSQRNSPLPAIKHQTWLQLCSLIQCLSQPTPLTPHETLPQLKSSNKELRQRLDPAVTFVKVILQIGTICQTSCVLFWGEWGAVFPGVVFYCWEEGKAEMCVLIQAGIQTWNSRPKLWPNSPLPRCKKVKQFNDIENTN